MRTSTWIAIGLALATTAWMASGYLFPVEDAEEQAEEEATPQLPLVEITISEARMVPVYLYAQGEARPFRKATTVTQTAGTVETINIQQGDDVERGARIAQIELDDLLSRRESAEEQVRTLEADLEGVESLVGAGAVAQTRLRELRARLAQARAELTTANVQIRNATITAPIAGIVEEVLINEGEYAPSGTKIATIVDNSPLRVTMQIAQQDFGNLQWGEIAIVSFATGGLEKGRICFVSESADPSTRTFAVEVRVSNEENPTPSFVSAEIRVQTDMVRAHFVSPSVFSLDEDGRLGVKSVNQDNKVLFQEAELVRTERDGVWISGLPDRLRLISVGQGFVQPGETVRVADASEAETSNEALGTAPIPTATIRSDPFSDAISLPSPIPAEVLCSRQGAVSAEPAQDAGGRSAENQGDVSAGRSGQRQATSPEGAGRP